MQAGIRLGVPEPPQIRRQRPGRRGVVGGVQQRLRRAFEPFATTFEARVAKPGPDRVRADPHAPAIERLRGQYRAARVVELMPSGERPLEAPIRAQTALEIEPTMTPPIPGPIRRLHGAAGSTRMPEAQLVAPGLVMAQVAPLDRLNADFEVGGPDIARVQPGLPALIRSSAAQREPFAAQVQRLAPALDALARDTQKSLGVPVDFRVSGPERRLAPEAELTLYRIAQEALSNVARHAQATHASLQLAFEPAAVALTVADNGRGFQNPESPSEFAPQGHFGLLGMHERAELIGARLEITAVPGHGVRLRVTIPQAQ